MGWLDTVGDFLTNNEKLIKGGLGVYNYLSGSNSRSDYQDAMNRAAYNDWERGRQEYEATKKYNEEYAAYVAANAASRAAAARANAANRQKAAKKAAAYMDEQLGQIAQNYKPFNTAALELLPQMQQAYGSGLNQLGLLQSYLNTPGMQARVANAGAPVDLRLSKKLVGGS